MIMNCSSRKKAVFVDRDGVINIDYGYVNNMSNFHVIFESICQLNTYMKMDYLIFIITNQSGIARKLYTEKQYLLFERDIENFLSIFNIKIEKTLHCPHHNLINGYCSCRKPNIGMVLTVLFQYNIETTQMHFLGDSIVDIKLAKKFDYELIGRFNYEK